MHTAGTREPDRYGLGIGLPAGFQTYGIRPDADVDQVLFSGQMKAEPSELAIGESKWMLELAE